MEYGKTLAIQNNNLKEAHSGNCSGDSCMHEMPSPAWGWSLMPLQYCCIGNTWPAPHMKNNPLVFSKAALIYADEGLAPCPVSSAESFSTFPGNR